MARPKNPDLIDVSCGKCKDFLAGVPVGSEVYCPRCNKWVTVGGDKDRKKRAGAKEG